MSTAERELLAAISRWNRTDPHTGATLKFWHRPWEPSFWPGWWRSHDGRIEVCWAEDREPSNTIAVTWQEERYGPERVARFEVTSVHEAVDVLVAFGVLPARFSSAFAAGYREGATDVPAGGPHVEPAPIQDPALAHHPGECCWLSVAPFSGGRYHASDCKGEHGRSS